MAKDLGLDRTREPLSTTIYSEVPFNAVLDRLTGSDPSVTDYVLEQPAKCPNCKREILEKTLIEPAPHRCPRNTIIFRESSAPTLSTWQ